MQEVRWYCHYCSYEWKGTRYRSRWNRRCPKCGRTLITPGTEDKSWPAIRSEIWKRDKYRCRICGVEKTKKSPLVVHHMRPVRHGGSSKLDNLILLCINCHDWEHRLLRGGVKAEYTKAGIPPLIYFIVGLLVVIVSAVFLLWFALVPLAVLLYYFTAYLLYRRRLKRVKPSLS